MVSQIIKTRDDFVASLTVQPCIQSCHVFHYKTLGTNAFDNPYKFVKKIISGIIEEFSSDMTCHTEPLTRGTAYNDIY